MKSIKILLILLLFIITPLVYPQNIGADLAAMVNSLNTVGNSTAPQAYDTQTRGGYYGGGFSVRYPNKTLQPFNITPPSFKPGCGGIDFHLGGVSFAKASEYLDYVKSLAVSTVTAYGFKLALDALSPTIHTVLTEIEKVTSQINQMQLNACEDGKALANVLHGETGLRETMANTGFNIFNSAAANNEALTGKMETAKQVQGTTPLPSGAKTDPQTKDKFIEGNLVWKILKEADPNMADYEKELIMSLIGTTVYNVNSDGTPGKVVPYPPREISPEDFLYGRNDTSGTGSANYTLPMYSCGGTTDCLSPSDTTPLVYTPFVKLIEARLIKIANALINDTIISNDDKNFVNMVKLPVYKMLAVATADKNNSSADYYINKYKDMIAFDFLKSYIGKYIEVSNRALKSKQKSNPIAEKDILEHLTSLQNWTKKLNTTKLRLQEDNTNLQDLITSVRQLEQSLYSNLSPRTRKMFNMN